MASYAHRFLLLWGGLSLVMFCVAAALTAALVRVSIVGSDYHPIGMYGEYHGHAIGWIYYERHESGSDFLVYYPAHTTVVALPHGRLGKCAIDNPATTLPSSAIERAQYEGRDYYLVTLSTQPHGMSSEGTLTCGIDFQSRRESFTGYSLDVWFMPKAPKGAEPAATLGFSASVEGAESMQVFGARSTSASGVDLSPDDEATVKFTIVWREGLRDIALVLIGAFVALGASMALEAIRPYVEATARGRPE
jgi:hypothetical protein